MRFRDTPFVNNLRHPVITLKPVLRWLPSALTFRDWNFLLDENKIGETEEWWRRGHCFARSGNLNASCGRFDYWSKPERISKEELFRRLADKEGSGLSTH